MTISILSFFFKERKERRKENGEETQYRFFVSSKIKRKFTLTVLIQESDSIGSLTQKKRNLQNQLQES